MGATARAAHQDSGHDTVIFGLHKRQERRHSTNFTTQENYEFRKGAK
jgi:hypothetical protein